MTSSFEYVCTTTNRAEWLEARRDGIGASEIAQVLGISPWGSAYSLYLQKIGTLNDGVDTSLMEWGRRLESVVLDKFKEEHPEFSDYYAGGMYRTKGRGWQIGSPDALAFTSDSDDFPVVVEVKTGTKRQGWGAEGTDQIPVYYRAQVQWLMDIVGGYYAYLPVLLDGREYREYYVERDNTDIKLMRARGAAFWNRVLNHDPPPTDGHSATSQALKGTRLNPGTVAQVPKDLVRKERHAKRLLDRAQALHTRHENNLRAALGEAQVGMAGAAVVAKRSEWEQNQTDIKALRDEFPDEVAKHTTKVTRSRLTVTEKELS